MSLRLRRCRAGLLVTAFLVLSGSAHAAPPTPSPLLRPAPNSPIALGDAPGCFVLEKVNQDGRLDLALAHHDSYAVMILIGDGNGGFVLADVVTSDLQGRSVTILVAG